VLGNAGVSILETIHIDEVPSGPIEIHVVFGAGVGASAMNGFANASASVLLNAFGAGSCTSATAATAGGGTTDTSVSNVAGSASQGTGMTVVLTPEQLDDLNYQVYVDVNASASIESTILTQSASAHVTGGSDALLAKRREGRGSEPVPGILYIEIDPPTAHHFTGSLTNFPVTPVPEPGAPLLVAVGAAVLAGCRRRAA
jgi:hypothetical protein